MPPYPSGDEMIKFSFIVRVQNPNPRVFNEMVESLEAQTIPDWRLYLVVKAGSAKDLAAARKLADGRSQVVVLERPKDEHLALATNHLLGTFVLGNWTGFLDQHDLLLPDTLETCEATAALQPEARVITTGECFRTRYGHESFRQTKPDTLDPIRLRTQEYLGHLSLVRTDALDALGGYDPMATDTPTHDLYLRLLEQHGPQVFVSVPRILCKHFRTYLEPESADPRRKAYRGRYDLYAIKQHLARTGQRGHVTQLHGRPFISTHLARPYSVTVLQVLGDDVDQGVDRIHALNHTLNYRPAQVVLLHRGENQQARLDYETLARALQWGYQQIEPDLPMPAVINARLPTEDSDYLMLLDARAVTKGWLTPLVEHAQLPDVAAVGGRLASTCQLEAPGILGYRYQGWDWNTAGRFAQLTVPHSTGALSPAGALYDTRILRSLGGFDETLITLYGMDYSLRLALAGHRLVSVPGVHLHLEQTSEPAAREKLNFMNRWAPWNDPYGLHFPLG